jgi:uncharacterized RDD family membrane protein YckC
VSELPSYPQEAAQREAAEAPPEEHRPYASWGRRAVAYLLDTLIVVAMLVAIGATAFAVGAVDETVGLVVFLIALVALIGVPIFYYTYFVGKSGQTWARRLLDIRVQHVRTGEPIGYGPALGRYLIQVAFGIFYLPLLVDYLWPLWDRRNQTLHDKVASSVRPALISRAAVRPGSAARRRRAARPTAREST